MYPADNTGVSGRIVLVRSAGRNGIMATAKAGKYWQIFKRQNSWSLVTTENMRIRTDEVDTRASARF